MKWNRFLILLLAALMLLPLQTLAAGIIDTSRDVSLTVKVRCEELALPGATVAVCQISQMDSRGNLTPLPEYSEFSQLLDIRGEDAGRWREAALVLERHIVSSETKPTDTVVSDANGLALFPSGETSLAQGLYLVLGIHHTQENYVYSTAPFFVLLPSRENSAWNYDVRAEAKAEETEALISLRVVKAWEDKYWESKRPSNITVRLLCDEQVYDTVTLPINGRWAYQWAGLEAAHNWWVEEAPVEGYLTQVYREGNTFVVKNVYQKPGTGDPTLPQTGQLWWPVPVMLAVGLLLILLGLLRRKGKGYET